jgi:hypothetical protein
LGAKFRQNEKKNQNKNQNSIAIFSFFGEKKIAKFQEKKLKLFCHIWTVLLV